MLILQSGGLGVARGGFRWNGWFSFVFVGRRRISVEVRFEQPLSNEAALEGEIRKHTEAQN